MLSCAICKPRPERERAARAFAHGLNVCVVYMCVCGYAVRSHMCGDGMLRVRASYVLYDGDVVMYARTAIMRESPSAGESEI